MNYFERLVRRALLRPASTPGAALYDPFAAVAEWPLEPPAPRPPPGAAPLADPPRAVEQSAEAAPLHVEAADVAPPAATPTPLVAVEPPLPSAQEPSPPAEGRPRGEDVTPPFAAPSVPAPTVAAPRQPALAVADAFMRCLGVQSQLPDAEPAAPSEPGPGRASPILEEREPTPSTPTPQVLPPLPPPPVLPPRARAETPEPDPPARADAREAPRGPAPPARTVVETRHVVVDRGGSDSGADAGVSGGGAPRFGLGQL